jgi:hypothetical protein
MTPLKFHPGRSVFLCAIATTAWAAHLPAQDSTAASRTPQRAWLSAAGGVGPVNGSSGARDAYGIAGELAGVYSRGLFFAEARTATDQEFIGDGVHDESLLVGGRSPGQGAFVMASVGAGRAHHIRTCDDCGQTVIGANQAVIAYEASAEVNAETVGIGVTLFGATGPPALRYVALALSVQLGKLR